MATIYDIADKANVSITTVSKVLNNSTDISQATKDRVTSVMKQLDYKPKNYKRDSDIKFLAKPKTESRLRSVAYLIPDPDVGAANTDLQMNTIHHLSMELEKIGASLIVCRTTVANELPICIREKQVDAVFCRHTGDISIIDLLKKHCKGIPLIWLHGRSLLGVRAHHSIMIHDEGVALEGLSYLLKQGREKILMINPQPNDHTHNVNDSQFRIICSQKGIPYLSIKILEDDLGLIPSLKNECKEFAGSAKCGIWIPFQARVIDDYGRIRFLQELSDDGCDLLDLSPSYIEAENRVRIPIQEFAEVCVDRLQALYENPDLYPCTLLVQNRDT